MDWINFRKQNLRSTCLHWHLLQRSTSLSQDSWNVSRKHSSLPNNAKQRIIFLTLIVPLVQCCLRLRYIVSIIQFFHFYFLNFLPILILLPLTIVTLIYFLLLNIIWLVFIIINRQGFLGFIFTHKSKNISIFWSFRRLSNCWSSLLWSCLIQIFLCGSNVLIRFDRFVWCSYIITHRIVKCVDFIKLLWLSIIWISNRQYPIIKFFIV